MVVELEDVVESEGHHIVHTRLVAGEHNLRHGAYEGFVLGEGELQPLSRYLLGTQIRIPCQPTEGIPVRLREVVSAPVGIVADICHTRNAAQPHGMNM